MPTPVRKSRQAEPDIAAVASLVAEPARARMLSVLMSGQAMTATELALEAGVAPSTASAHLARLEREAVLVAVKQGRYRYYRLEDADVAAVLESLMGLAAVRASRTFGPRDPALRQARVCFDHLAGAAAVRLADAFCRAERFAAYQKALGDRFVGRVLPDSAANPDAIMKNPHSVVTAHLIDRAGEPTRQALDEILGFFRQRLVAAA